MTSLHEIIGNLIFRHNCVILPEFGGFIANKASARIDWKKNAILPPFKTVSFNKNLNSNDGLLIQAFAEENKISFNEANVEVSETIRDWKEKLKKGNRIEIEKVGFLFFDKENNICFEQDRFFNLLMSSFGLQNIQFISEEKAEEIVAPIVELKSSTVDIVEPSEKVNDLPKKVVTPIYDLDQVEIPSVTFTGDSNGSVAPFTKPKAKRKYWKYAAAAILLPLGFYSLWIPMKTNVLQSGIVAKQDFNPFSNQPKPEYTKVANEDANFDEAEYNPDWSTLIKDLPKEVKIFSYKFDDDFYIPVRLKNKEVAISTNVVLPENTSSTANLEGANIHVIAGCFSQKSNAEAFVKDMQSQGYSAYILDLHNGLHRVSVIQVKSKSVAKKKRAELKAAGLSSWILSK